MEQIEKKASLVCRGLMKHLPPDSTLSLPILFSPTLKKNINQTKEFSRRLILLSHCLPTIFSFSNVWFTLVLAHILYWIYDS